MTTRRPSPMRGEKPTREDLARFATDNPDAIDDVISDTEDLRLLIVGVNPGLWTAAVNAPFAHPGNRFWPGLFHAGLTGHRIDTSRGLSAADEDHLHRAGIGITNLVGRASVRADELTREELRAGAAVLITRLPELRPRVVAVAGITAFRTAFELPKAMLGKQDTTLITGWPAGLPLWVVPQPSGLNAHETIDTLAQKWRAVWEDVD
ncbi:mismatch-specific DNA-glycosylase [Mycetocola tolaasinivorans]|uniref:Mismatch-specific DNA-glycosylase n=1 Tax=Mycetocola tolaasinivorans TaxID=76635 RepID=A0A3L7A5P7_9MICO|nr:mismatch-specific DNA-glycosylase [Mycetocola tolaasinivorans]RLP75557.1 mismatch-specific DNA-glycosylase [Mycetocola tolaasinivorans]